TAEVDLVRARVVGDVVGLAGAVGEVGDAVRAADDGVGDPRAGRSRDDVTRAQLVRLRLDAALHRHRRRQQLERAASLEHDDGLFRRRVAVRRHGAPAGLGPVPVQSRALGAGAAGELLVADLVERQLVEGDDVLRPRARLGELELADLGLDLPWVGVAAL